MSNNTATGTLHLIKQAQQVTEKFTKQEFVLRTDGERPQYVSFQVTNDRTKLLDGLAKNDVVTVHYNLEGREWASPTGEIKYFNTLTAWRIERSGASDKPVPPDTVTIKEGDLPF